MAIRDILNAHNGNIRSQGNYAPWISDINDEIYQNLDQLEGKDNNQLEQINQILSIELPQKQNQINDHENRLQNSQSQINQILNIELPQKQNQINDHENRLQNHQNLINSISNEINEKQSQINQIVSSDLPEYKSKLDQHQSTLNDYAQKIREFDSKIATFTKESVDSLGVHFADNYTQLKAQTDSWLTRVWIGFAILILAEVSSAIYLIETSKELQSYFLFVPITVIGGTLLYFLVAQYSQYKKLALEYKNRQVVAQSYLGILVNSDGDQKNIITAIVAETLFSRNVTDQGSDLPVKDAMHLAEKMLDTSANVARR